jgi:hypothetical protein
LISQAKLVNFYDEWPYIRFYLVVVLPVFGGKEIKRFKNIEIPDELKKLEYQDFQIRRTAERRYHIQDHVRSGRAARGIPTGAGAEDKGAQERAGTCGK